MRHAAATYLFELPLANEPTGAVFMSYTWQDAEPALRIADALRAAKHAADRTQDTYS